MAERAGRTATIRFRVTALATVAVLAMLTITATVVILRQQAVATESLDEALALEADDLATTLATPVGTRSTTLAGVIDDDGVAQVVRDSEVVASTPNIVGNEPIAPAPDDPTAITTVDHVLDGEPAFRVLSRRIDRQETIHVGASLEDGIETTQALLRSLAIAVPVVAAAVAFLVWHLVGRTLAPVEAIRAEVASIDAGDLHRRVPQPATDDEIGRLARTMNAMLDRLEDASIRQRRFAEDASHELRSPLTRIRSEVEVDLANPALANPFATLDSVRNEAIDLERLTDDLLLLARAEATTANQPFRPVDLDDIVLRHVSRLRAREQVQVDATAVSGAQVLGDDRQLIRAVGNLLDNAVRHAASSVTVTLGEADSSAVLTVADDGPGVPPDQRERIFERFTRIDDARTRDAGGAGLGLAITRAIIERHSGTVMVDDDDAGGARFVLRLPLAES